MGLREQQLTVRFAGGIETKMDSKVVPSARLLALENGVFTKAISIKKRNGYDGLTTEIDGTGGDDYVDARKLATRDDELLVVTDRKAYSYQAGTDRWSDTGNVMAVPGTERAVVRTASAQTMPDHATNGGVVVYAWEDSRGGVWWTVEDATSGRVYRESAQADANAQRPRCLAVGEALHVYYALPATSKIMVLVINPADPSANVTAKILVDDLLSSNPVYDACTTNHPAFVPGVGTTIQEHAAFIAWAEHATTNARFGYVTPGGDLGSPVNGYPSVERILGNLAATTPIAVAHQDFEIAGGGPGDDLVSVLFVDGTTAARISTYEAGTPDIPFSDQGTNTWTTGWDFVRITAAYDRGTDDRIWAIGEKDSLVTNSKNVCVAVLMADGGLIIEESDIVLRGMSLVSRAFAIGDATNDFGSTDVFAYVVHDTTYFNTYFALRLGDWLCVARQVCAAASGVPARTHLSSVHVDDDDVARVCLPQKERLESANNDKFAETGLHLLTLDFDDDNARQTAQLGAGLVMAGACPQHYDGRVWTELGFHVGPEFVGTPTKAAGGSMTTGATYLYRFWYEWTDNQGEVHRGPESAGTTVVMGVADTQVTIALPTLRLTQKDNVRICVARSLPGDSARLFRATSLDPTTSGAAANGYVANDTTLDAINWIDRMSDANLQLEEPHYTNGGILSNDPVALGSLVTVGNNRMFFSDAADPNLVRFSKEITQGYGVELAPELFVPCDPFGGAVTAIAVMDTNVILFKEGAIFAFNGDGPLDNGDTSTSGFSAPRLVTSDVGCSAPGSLVLTPMGLMFKSAKGIYLLDRSLSTSYVGAPVEAYNAQNVTRATVMPDRSQVVFLSSDGTTLLFDFLFGQWSTFTNHVGLDGVVSRGTYHYLRSNGVVYRETIGEYSDNGSRITLKFETAWLHLHEHLQGLQRFWKMLLLGTWGSPHQLGISYRTNFDESWSEAEWLDATGESSSTGWITGDNANAIGEDPLTGSTYGEGAYGDGPYGGRGPDVYQWRMGLHTEGQSIQFRFEDFERAGLAGATFELTEMTIIGGVKKLDNRPFSGARST